MGATFKSIPKQQVPKKLVSITEAADMGYGSRSVLRRRVEDGTIPAYMVGGLIKFKIEDLDAYLVPVSVKGA